MKIRTLASCLAIGLWILAQPANASQRSDLEKKGLASVTGKELAEVYVGKTCRSKAFDGAGKVKSTSKNVYKKDGTVIKTSTRSGSPETRNRKWWMDGSRFCETLFDNDKPYCKGNEIFFRLKNKLYYFTKKGAIKGEITC